MKLILLILALFLLGTVAATPERAQRGPECEQRIIELSDLNLEINTLGQASETITKVEGFGEKALITVCKSDGERSNDLLGMIAVIIAVVALFAASGAIVLGKRF